MKTDVMVLPKTFSKRRRSSSSHVSHRGKSYVLVSGNQTRIPFAPVAQRTKLKSGGSLTATKRKPKTPVAGPKPCIGGNGSWSSFWNGKKATKLGRMLKMLPQPYYYTTNGATLMNVAQGSQNAVLPLQLFNYQDLQVMVQDYAAQHPVLPTRVGITTVSQRFLLQECHAKLMVTNLSQDTLFYVIYDIGCRRDLASGAANDSPILAWNAGNTNEGFHVGDGVPVAAAFNQVNTTPMQSLSFRQNFKIMKKTVGTLGPSAIHTHSVTLKPNRIFNGEFLNNSNLTTGFFKSLSYFTMVVAYGAPVTDDANVSTGSCRLGFVATRNYIFKGIESSTEVIYNANGLVNNLTAEKLIAEGTSAIITAAASA